MVSHHSLRFLQSIVIFHLCFQAEAPYLHECSDTVSIRTCYVQVAVLWLCTCHRRTALQPKPLPTNIQLLCRLPQLPTGHHGLPPLKSLWPQSWHISVQENPVGLGLDGLSSQRFPCLPGAAGEVSLYPSCLPKQMCWGWTYSGLSASCLTFLPDVLFLLSSIYYWYLGKALAPDAQSFWPCSSAVFSR